MHKTLKKGSTMGIESRITINTETLAECLDCGKNTAVKIGEAAGARIQIGKRVLWNVHKVQQYLDGKGMIQEV